MNTIVKKIIVGISSLLALGVVTSFEGDAKAAGTATSNLSVSASVSANCTISTSALAFGAYDPVSTNAAAPLDGTGGVTVTCTQGASTTITLGQGTSAKVASTDAVPLRQMADGANRLEYFIYQDAGHSTVWGNTAGTGVGHTGTGTATSITAYGRVSAGQNVPSGSYTDTVVATVTF